MKQVAKKIDDWFLDRFVPWLKFVSTGVGMLAICGGMTYMINRWVEGNFVTIFVWVFVLSGAVFVTVRDRRLQRRIDELIEEEKDAISEIFKDPQQINRTAENRTINVILRKLREEGFGDTAEKGSLCNAVSKSVTREAIRISRAEKAR